MMQAHIQIQPPFFVKTLQLPATGKYFTGQYMPVHLDGQPFELIIFKVIIIYSFVA
jgi:hypothetical protein